VIDIAVAVRRSGLRGPQVTVAPDCVTIESRDRARRVNSLVIGTKRTGWSRVRCEAAAGRPQEAKKHPVGEIDSRDCPLRIDGIGFRGFGARDIDGSERAVRPPQERVTMYAIRVGVASYDQSCRVNACGTCAVVLLAGVRCVE
jgi:hypothetical protein